MNTPETVLPMLISQNNNIENKQYTRETVPRLISQDIENNEHIRIILPMLISQNNNIENKQYTRETVPRLISQNIENNEHTRNSIANVNKPKFSQNTNRYN